MSLIPGLFPRAPCVDCSNVQVPACNCAPNEECQKINKDCGTCATIKCVTKGTTLGSSPSGGGVSKGALAGAIVGVLAFLAISVGILLWYRRSPRFARNHGRQQAAADKPAPAADVLNRPNPTEKTLSPEPSQASQDHYFVNSHSNVDRDPEAHPPSSRKSNSVLSNPFADGHSIQTAGTEGTNVIPIALVVPGSNSPHSSPAAPARPARTPEIQLNLDHVNVSHDNLKVGAGSQCSGVSGATRNSYMTSASYASDLLSEAPMIVTPTVRHVLGSAKAEMVDARSPISDGFKTPTSATRPPIRSPLAHSSLSPSDYARSSDPFSDPRLSIATTRGSAPHQSGIPDIEASPWSHEGSDGRPTSMSTQAGSIVDISSATRVNISTLSGQSAYRTMVGRLVTPSSAGLNTMQEQQRNAVESQGFDASRRTSGVSAISATADSILEAFPFVPPSPISNRPMRTPPVSPLAQETFSFTPASPASPNFQKTAANTQGGFDLVAPDRHMLGMSTGSQLSTSSTGLGSFPFQIEDAPDASAPPSSLRHRASLDTLAITSDLSSYPLGFDKDHAPRRKD